MPLGSCYTRAKEFWRWSSRREKILMGVNAVATVFLVIFSIALISRHTPNESDCKTPSCVIEAARIIQQIDPSVDPCDDFYKFACGTYVKNARGDPELDPTQLLYAQAERQIHELYMEPIRQDDHYMVQVEKKFFRACMNTTAIDKDHVHIIMGIFEALGGWPLLEGPKWDEAKFDWVKATYKLRNLGYPFDIYLDLLVSPDPRNDSKLIFEVTTPRPPNTLENRKEIMINYTLMFESHPQYALTEIEEMYQFEEKMRNVRSRYILERNVFSIEKLQKACSSVNWLEFINTISSPAPKVDMTDSVKIVGFENLRTRLDLISSTSKRTQANYLIFRMLEKIMPYFTQKHETRKHRLRYCYTQLSERFVPNPMYIMYLRKYLPKKKIEHIENLVLSVQNTLVSMIQEAQWLDVKAKQSLEEKAKKITILISKPIDYLTDAALNQSNVDMKSVSNENFLNLLAQAIRNEKSQTYAAINKPKETLPSYHRSDWMFLMSSVRYHKATNTLSLPTILLQNAIFDENRPNYLNYGALGTPTAKALTRLITEKPTNFEQLVSKIEPWSNETAKRFETFERCIKKNIDDFGVPQNLNVLKTLVTQIVGVRIAYNTYKNWISENGEERKVTAIEYSPKQMFWISSIMCHSETDYGNLGFDTPSYRSSLNFVTNVIMRNNPEFVKDFNCPDRSKMKPSLNCFNL